MCGNSPFRHCPENSDRSSCSALAWFQEAFPIAMQAASQLHWCGYSRGDGDVAWPSQLASRTALALPINSASGSEPVVGAGPGEMSLIVPLSGRICERAIIATPERNCYGRMAIRLPQHVASGRLDRGSDGDRSP